MNNRIALYIPSIQKTGEAVKSKKKVLKETLLFFAENFGGATSYNAFGSWKLSNGQLQIEPITIVYSYTDKLTPKNQIAFKAFANNIKTICNQEAVSIEIDNGLQFI